jgi:hypothetical protein
MMLTVNRLRDEGVHHCAMVHDSFGVHAWDIDLLSRVLTQRVRSHLFRTGVAELSKGTDVSASWGPSPGAPSARRP